MVFDCLVYDRLAHSEREGWWQKRYRGEEMEGVMKGKSGRGGRRRLEIDVALIIQLQGKRQ